VNGDTGRASIQTFTGKYVRPYDLQPGDVDVVDIAHALSNVCRFQGHTREFYSVAQHCVICSTLVEPELALPALLHDSPEAYACDLAGPLKRDTPIGRAYKRIEADIAAAIESALGMRHGAFDDLDVKRADWELLQVEGRQLMPTNDWARVDILPNMTITPWLPHDAENKFLRRYSELADGR
jgi:hypothetical protein